MVNLVTIAPMVNVVTISANAPSSVLVFIIAKVIPPIKAKGVIIASTFFIVFVVFGVFEDT